MATEFKVVFEAEVSPRFAAQVNAAVQSAVLNLVAQNFPDPDGPEPTGPGGPVEDFIVPPRLRGIIFSPRMAASSLE